MADACSGSQDESPQDARVDLAVRHVLADTPGLAEDPFQAGRAGLLAVLETGEPANGRSSRRRRSGRVLGLSAVAAAIAVGVVVVPSLGGPELTPAASAGAVDVLNRAAGLSESAGTIVVPPGQYLYPGRRDAQLTMMSIRPKGEDKRDCVYRSETVTELWIPADTSKEWLQRTTQLNHRTWLRCNEQDAVKAGERLPQRPRTSENRAPGGRFETIEGVDDQGVHRMPPPGFGNPTPEFVASLPSEPQELYEQAVADNP